MASPKKPTSSDGSATADYRHTGAKRKNVPTASMAAEGEIPKVPKARYEYSPHLPPVLRFDPTGKADKLPELLAEAAKRALKPEELKTLAEALRRNEPWLEWSGKRESDLQANGRGFLEVDPVALHIHERVSAQAILKVAARQDVYRDLFADPEQEYRDAVQFYQHDVDWANRLILGDSLQVMSSLARREGLAGKVQMIYIDPPYGIKFASNFQPEVGKRDVKDKEEDLTREPEMVRAYRDTWNLGVHSYLAYLRDRLIVARELLADTGSVFVQISDENVHRIRLLMDEVFGESNFCGQIQFMKATGLTSELLPSVSDTLVWFAKDRAKMKFSRLFRAQDADTEMDGEFRFVELPSGAIVNVSDDDSPTSTSALRRAGRIFRTNSAVSPGVRANTTGSFMYQGRSFHSGGDRNWKTVIPGMLRLAGANRLDFGASPSRMYRQFLEDFPLVQQTNYWVDVRSEQNRVYVVQTVQKVVARCLLMTTDPGDLVLDPTCGSGTTAYVAEQWGRRWITIDTSRVALAIARQRILTSKFDYYKTRRSETSNNPADGFVYKTVPHITLKSIAQNSNLDPIFARHEPILEAKLAAANAALGHMSDTLRQKLVQKLWEKQRTEGKKAISDADRRRWELPKKGERWEHWQVPFDTDPDWPRDLQEAVTAYRKAWRAKMDEVNACISANAEQEELVDQPEVVKGVVRVSGPFTVEAVQPPEVSLMEPGFEGGPGVLEETFDSAGLPDEAKNTLAYLRQMYGLLKRDGVRFLGNREMTFSRLDPLFESGRADAFHAEGRWAPKGTADTDAEGIATVGVVFGPQYGPVTAKMVEEIIRPAGRRYDDLVIAGFSFDGPAQQAIRDSAHPKLRIHMAHIRPDVNPGMTGLLKEQPGSQLFTVFGQPRVTAKKTRSGEWTVEMEGVDIYDPVTNNIIPTKGEKVAAWFLDGDYDGRTFCVTQAFFPDKDAWAKLARALKGVLDEDRFAAFSGTVSLPFPAGKYKRAAVKAIDPRGNEVMATVRLEG